MDFALIMFLLLVVSGGIWLLDHVMSRPARSASRSYQKLEENLSSQGMVKAIVVNGKTILVTGRDELLNLLARHDKAGHVAVMLASADGDRTVTLSKEPIWTEYAKSFFPVILVVFLIRSFLFEPFKIPSGSMIPTLQVGDFILVNKFTYGIRLPIISIKIMDMGNPARGDVMVFHYPENPSIDYIKRIVGLPGDEIVYRDKQLFVNGELQQQTAKGEYNYVDNGLSFIHTNMFEETLGKHRHAILKNPEVPGLLAASVADFPMRENCVYTLSEFKCKVPEGHYFALGDNRDNSRDSRYWGFVPDRMVVGKAFLVWMNFGDYNRIGLTIN